MRVKLRDVGRMDIAAIRISDLALGIEFPSPCYSSAWELAHLRQGGGKGIATPQTTTLESTCTTVCLDMRIHPGK